MRHLLFSTVAILSLAAAMPASAQQSGSGQPTASQRTNQPATSQQTNERGSSQQGMQEQNFSKEEIQQVQHALDQKGFKAGQADGVLGPETKNALKEFQQKQGLNATGELDSQTMSALGVAMNGQNGQAAGQRPNTTGQQPPSNESGRNAR